MSKPPDVDAFIRRWEKASGTERANYQLFLTELCKLLDLPQPDPPAREDTLLDLRNDVLGCRLLGGDGLSRLF